MKFNAVRNFIAVAERGSLRAAARHLDIPQPAITRSIHELEKELGVPLFERSHKGVQLTPMGQTFLRRANAACNELQLAKEEIGQLRGQAHGTVTICLSSVPHLALLPEALRPFRARFPGVALRIIDAVFPHVEASLKDGTIDCYIGPLPAQVPVELHSEKLFDNTRIILGRKGHPLARARSLRELVDAEWITTSITHKAEEELGPLFAKHGLPAPRLVMRAQSSLTFLVSMAYSDLLMMMPVQWVQIPLWKDVLEPIYVRESLPAPPICLVQRAGMPLTPAADYFCTLIRRAGGRVHPQAPPH
ncbi:LysR substrate-binding domain-containing protein [Candidimonas nitroreducens]|uniref:LysR family transcriptional regulator n=1 Tax=Candidimonas nitroreducens TaxID=683354 RepID=A0A225M1U4_9BURK|nr:LysR substrate-binding domain-containing protein [Candidimonas nitroreducens]OWT55297.1 LysR family transcriptional regulator [Candidimonas nitroreducens]